MAEKTFITKCMQNIATKEQWDTIASTYVPLNGELIFYSNINNFKVGDGITTLNKLRFYLTVYATAPITIYCIVLNSYPCCFKY